MQYPKSQGGEEKGEKQIKNKQRFVYQNLLLLLREHFKYSIYAHFFKIIKTQSR